MCENLTWEKRILQLNKFPLANVEMIFLKTKTPIRSGMHVLPV